MPFNPPGFSTLSVNTLNLEASLSIFLGRYKVAASSNLDMTVLASLLNQTRKISSCDTGRTTQRDVFTQLVNELNEVLSEGDEHKIQRATLFLLGALLHRYFRILKESEKLNSYTYFSFFSLYDLKSCRLFIAIRDALELPKIDDDFKTKDLETIDVVTIVTALEVFRDNMFDSETAPRYKNYPHFVQDTNFKSHLDGIIKEHRVRGAEIIRQFKAVSFIQSLEKQFRLESSLLMEALQDLALDLEQECTDFHALNQDILEKCVEKKVKSPFYKELICDLIDLKFFKKTFDELKQFDEPGDGKEAKYLSLVKAIQTCYLEKARFIISGGYALILESIPAENFKDTKGLKFCIYQALDLEKNPKDLADSDIQFCLRVLNDFLNDRPSLILDTEFFGGKDKMNTQLINIRAAVSERSHSMSSVSPGQPV